MQHTLYLVQEYHIPPQLHTINQVRSQILLNFSKLILVWLYLFLIVQFLNHLWLQNCYWVLLVLHHFLVLLHVNVFSHDQRSFRNLDWNYLLEPLSDQSILDLFLQRLNLLEKRMRFQFFPPRPGVRILLQHPTQQFLQLRWHLLRVLHLLVQDQWCQLRVRIGIKRRLPREQLVNDATKRPNVHLVRVLSLPQDLRCDVQWCPLHRLEKSSRRREFLSKSKVTNLDLVVTKKDVLCLEIPVHDLVLVEVNHSVEDLDWKFLDLIQRQSLYLFHEPCQVPPCIIRHYDNLPLSFDDIFKLNDIGMTDLLEYFILLPEVLELSLTLFPWLDYKNTFFQWISKPPLPPLAYLPPCTPYQSYPYQLH